MPPHSGLCRIMRCPHTVRYTGECDQEQGACDVLRVVECSFPIPVGTIWGSQFENNDFTGMCSGSDTGSYLRIVDCVYHSTLGLRVTKKRRRGWGFGSRGWGLNFIEGSLPLKDTMEPHGLRVSGSRAIHFSVS